MNLKVVSNSTPLIALSLIDRLNIIKELFGSITIPDAVFLEVTSDIKKRPGSDEVLNANWIKTTKISNNLIIDFISVNLDLGEAEAIILAKEIGADLILIDEKMGRKMAKSVGITVTGTVGLLLRYYRGQAEDFKSALDELIAKGFRISTKEYLNVLAVSEDSVS